MRRLFAVPLFGAVFLPAAVYAQTQAAKPVVQPVSSTGYLFQGLFGLLVVLGLMWAAWWLVRRTGFNRVFSGVNMRVVGGLSVGNRERVMVVEIGEHWLILGVTPTQINTLATMPRQELPEGAGEAASPSFAVWLKKVMDRRNGENDQAG